MFASPSRNNHSIRLPPLYKYFDDILDQYLYTMPFLNEGKYRSEAFKAFFYLCELKKNSRTFQDKNRASKIPGHETKFQDIQGHSRTVWTLLLPIVASKYKFFFLKNAISNLSRTISSQIFFSIITLFST